jgi:hypothetical protein
MVDWSIKFSYTSVRHPKGNPVERWMREIGRLCRAYCSTSQKSWACFIPDFERWLNNTIQSTGFTATLLQFGREKDFVRTAIKFPLSDLLDFNRQAKQNLENRAAERIKSHPVKRYPKSEFRSKDLVWIKSNFQSSLDNQVCKKLFPLYVGPYMILKKIHYDTYLLGTVDGKSERGIFNISELKRVVTRRVFVELIDQLYLGEEGSCKGTIVPYNECSTKGEKENDETG